MDFDFSPEQYTLRDEARRFLAEQCPTVHVREFLDDPQGWSRDLWKRMSDLGWMALPFPEEVGGLGRSFLDLVLLLEELGQAVAPVPFLSSVCMAGGAILRHASAEQQARLLPGIASGEQVAALAFAAPGGSFEPSEVSVRARPDGETWRLDGEARPVLDAPAADLFVVAAREPHGEPPSGSLRWFVVESGAAVSVLQGLDRTRPVGAVRFDATPAEPLERPGLEPALGLATAGVCAEMVGTAARVLDMSVAYAKEREQFGRPIGSFQAIKHKAAEMLTDLEASRSATSYACWAVATEAEDAPLAVSIAKSFCAEALARVGGEGVQIHGGIAFTWEHDLHLFLRRIKSDQALLGDAAAHRERIARLTGLLG